MQNVKYSQDLLKDFDKLIKDFCAFMTFNVAFYKNYGFSGGCQKSASELIRISSDNAKRIGVFFETPLLKHEAKNREKLEKNLQNIITFLYNYLNYAEPIVKSCFPEELKQRFSDIKKHYLSFYAKYIA